MVTVMSHPDTGNVITPSSNNPEYGTIRVDSTQKVFTNGFFSFQKRSAFIRGKIEDLQKAGFSEGQQLQGKIQRQESFNPFYEGQSPKINPETEEEVLTNGKLTYLQFEYTDNANAPDVWVENAIEVAEEAPNVNA